MLSYCNVHSWMTRSAAPGSPISTIAQPSFLRMKLTLFTFPYRQNRLNKPWWKQGSSLALQNTTKFILCYK